MAQTGEAYTPTDRRPIASRERPFWQHLAARLSHARVSPNLISVCGAIFAVIAGLLLWWTGRAGLSGASGGGGGAWVARLAWLGAAAGIQLRLICNLIDGMVAIASGRASPVGELYNEIPDRVSDAAVLIGAGYAAGGDPVLGFTAACVAIFTAYVRAVGKAAGVSQLFFGPMAKQQRMFTLTVAALALAILPRAWQPDVAGRGLMSAALAIVIAGGLWTSVRRLRRVAHVLRSRTT